MNQFTDKLFQMRTVINEIDRRTNEECVNAGLTLRQFDVLRVLLEQDRLPIGKIRDNIFSTDGTIIVIIKNLEKMGFVKKYADKKDKRKTVIGLTSAGKELVEALMPSYENIVQSVLADE